jgi:DNA-directed RNA polymerase subunit RPC12/RpoP
MVAEEHRYPCAQCGAELRFAPGVTRLRCDHCGHEQSIAPDGPWGRAPKRFAEIPLARGLADDLPATEVVAVRATKCPNCGAEVQFQGASHATECPFCASPVVVDTGTERRLKPQAVLPFQLDEPAAHKAMRAWLGSLWFAPNGLLQYARAGRAMNGVYTPYWTFDADTSTDYLGQRGDAYYETRRVVVNVNGRNEERMEQVRKIRWTPVRGHVARGFDDVLAPASSALPRDMADRLEPWDLSLLETYRPDYLAGFAAEGYTVALAEGNAHARDKMESVIQSDIRRDIGGDEQRIDRMAVDWRDETFKHILLPIWMAAYKYNGKSYRFLVNGQTGEVQGERPWSVWKIAFAVLAAALVAGGLYYINRNA